MMGENSVDNACGCGCVVFPHRLLATPLARHGGSRHCTSRTIVFHFVRENVLHNSIQFSWDFRVSTHKWKLVDSSNGSGVASPRA